MKRGNYVTPYTRRICVCTEGTFASSVVKEDPQSQIETTGHAINEITGEWNTDDSGWTQE